MTQPYSTLTISPPLMLTLALTQTDATPENKSRTTSKVVIRVVLNLVRLKHQNTVKSSEERYYSRMGSLARVLEAADGCEQSMRSSLEC